MFHVRNVNPDKNPGCERTQLHNQNHLSIAKPREGDGNHGGENLAPESACLPGKIKECSGSSV